MTGISEHVFSVVDYIVLGSMVMISVIIGAFFAYRDKDDHTTRNYFLGSQSLQSIPVGLSLVVTFQSSIMIIGVPGEAYAYGMQYFMEGFGIVAAYFLATVIVVPVFHPLKVTTIYQYYNIRFGDNYVRLLALFCGALHYTFYMGLVMFGTGLALESAAGIPSWASILVLSFAAIIYTAVGGLKSVIWTDVFQSFVMIVGILAVLIKSTVKAGGLVETVELSRSRLNLFYFNPDPTIRLTFWSSVTGGFFHFLYFSISQASIQRINSTKTVKAAKRLFYLAGPAYAVTLFLVMAQGLAIFAYFTRQGCDPLASGKIDNVNMIIPFTIVELFHDSPGLPGLFLAALSAASLSTISSGLSCLSAMTYNDCVKLLSANISDRKGTTISKLVVVVYGLISIGFAFSLSNVKGPLAQILSSMTSALMGPQIGLYLCCVFYHRATSKGVIVGVLSGSSLVLWLSFGQNFLASIPKAPFLPLGPTDKCLVANNSHILANLTLYSEDTVLMGRDFNNSIQGYDLFNNTISERVDSEMSNGAVNAFYSISFMYFNMIGCIATVLVSCVVSMFTQPKEPLLLNKATVMDLSVLIPSWCRNRCNRSKSKPHNPSTTSDQETGHELLPKA